jgi:hypothetical protein
MKKLIIFIILLILVVVGVMLIHSQHDYSVNGIDISHHNVVRNWDKVNAAQDSTV